VSFLQPGIKDIIDIILIFFIIYEILKLFKGTRAVFILLGIVTIILFSLLSVFMNLRGLNWLISAFAKVGFLALIIIFQPEIRRGLALLGKNPIIKFVRRLERSNIQELLRSVSALRQRGLGAIIVLEGSMKLDEYIEESGVKLKAELQAPLLVSIFVPQSPLHDGAVIVRGRCIIAARVILPLSQIGQIESSLGTRHRAALGISEQTDAIAVVISEERRSVRLAHKGTLTGPLTLEELSDILGELIAEGEEGEGIIT